MRRARRLPAAAVLVVALTVGFASPSSAVELPDPFGCKPEAPMPRAPGDGLAGMAAVKPSPVPPPEDPFAPGAKTSVYEQYGGAGLWWPTYDLGCLKGTTTGLMGEAWTGIANLEMSITGFITSVTASLRQVAWSDDWVKGIDDAGRQVTGRLGGWFTTAMGLALIGVGLVIVWRAKRADYSDTAHHAGWAIGMLALGTLALGYPSWAGQEYDNVTIGGTRMIADAIAGRAAADTVAPVNRDEAIGHIHDDAEYRIWLRGMFGNDRSATAVKYGPRFYRAMALSWSEADTVAKGGDDAKGIIDRKRDEFTHAAEDLKGEDPAAYAHMQGIDGADTRTALGLVSVLAAIIMCVFLAIAGLLVFLCRIMGRVYVMALPVVTPIAANKRFAGPMRKITGMVTACVVNLLIFTIASGVFAAISSGILASSIPLPISVSIMGAGTLIAWHATKPVRSIAHIAGAGAVAGAAGAMAGGAVRGMRRGVGSEDDYGAPDEETAAVPAGGGPPDDSSAPPAPAMPVPEPDGSPVADDGAVVVPAPVAPDAGTPTVTAQPDMPTVLAPDALIVDGPSQAGPPAVADSEAPVRPLAPPTPLDPAVQAVEFERPMPAPEVPHGPDDAQ